MSDDARTMVTRFYLQSTPSFSDGAPQRKDGNAARGSRV